MVVRDLDCLAECVASAPPWEVWCDAAAALPLLATAEGGISAWPCRVCVERVLVLLRWDRDVSAALLLEESGGRSRLELRLDWDAARCEVS